MKLQSLQTTFLILAILIAIVVILVFSKPFLVPVIIAALLSMLLLPVAKWFKQKGLNETFSIVLSILLLISGLALFIGLIGWQLADLTQNFDEIEKQLTKNYHKAQEYVASNLGISVEKQEQIKEKSESDSPGKIASFTLGILKGAGGILTDTILVFVYIFLFICFRSYFKRFLLQYVPVAEHANARDVISQVQKVCQKYLSGMALMIGILWIMYGIGFTIAGVDNAIFFAILCGILEIVPFVGNLIGTSLTLIMAFIQGGGGTLIIAIIVTYATIQFIQTYIIEPLIVGSEVNLNPVFTILGLVAGELVWGVAGMVLAIPLLGITKIVCDHIEPLKPIGELIGVDKKKNEKGLGKKIKGFFQKLT